MQFAIVVAHGFYGPFLEPISRTCANNVGVAAESTKRNWITCDQSRSAQIHGTTAYKTSRSRGNSSRDDFRYRRRVSHLCQSVYGTLSWLVLFANRYGFSKLAVRFPILLRRDLNLDVDSLRVQTSVPLAVSVWGRSQVTRRTILLNVIATTRVMIDPIIVYHRPLIESVGGSLRDSNFSKMRVASPQAKPMTQLVG